MVELVPRGGPFTVFAVDIDRDLFLIYLDDEWIWVDMDKCKPYTYPPYLTTIFTDGGATT